MRQAGVVGLLMVAGCSPGDQPAPAAQATHDSAPGGSTAQTVPSGAGLHGEVSPLSGTISDFKVTVSATETVVELPADILFAFDSADLTTAAGSPLQRTADLIAKGAPGNIRVVGHTDAKGEVPYNIDLSQRRAQAVAAWLVGHGVTAARMQSEGRGESDPVAPNEGVGGIDSPAGRALNRRVVIYIPR